MRRKLVFVSRIFLSASLWWANLNYSMIRAVKMRNFLLNISSISDIYKLSFISNLENSKNRGRNTTLHWGSLINWKSTSFFIFRALSDKVTNYQMNLRALHAMLLYEEKCYMECLKNIDNFERIYLPNSEHPLEESKITNSN